MDLPDAEYLEVKAQGLVAQANEEKCSDTRNLSTGPWEVWRMDDGRMNLLDDETG